MLDAVYASSQLTYCQVMGAPNALSFHTYRFNTLIQCQTHKGTMMNILKRIALPVLWSLKTASYRAQGLCTKLEMDFLSAIDRIDRSYADKRWVAKWKTAPEKEPF